VTLWSKLTAKSVGSALGQRLHAKSCKTLYLCREARALLAARRWTLTSSFTKTNVDRSSTLFAHALARQLATTVDTRDRARNSRTVADGYCRRLLWMLVALVLDHGASNGTGNSMLPEHVSGGGAHERSL